MTTLIRSKVLIGLLLFYHFDGATSSKQVKIIGGYDARQGQFPWQISFKEQKSVGNFYHVCGGTLISPRHVLSAGHCFGFVNWTEQGDHILAVAGAHNITMDDEPMQQKVQLCNVKLHPKYKYIKVGEAITSDFAIITLKSPFQITERVMPLRLAPAKAEPIGTVCVMVGWGFTKPIDDPTFTRTQILQALNMTAISNDECGKYILEEPDIYFPVDESVLCTKVPGGGKIAANMDSGGGLICYDDQGPYLAGVISFGHTVGPVPTVAASARVSYALDFITCGGN